MFCKWKYENSEKESEEYIAVCIDQIAKSLDDFVKVKIFLFEKVSCFFQNEKDDQKVMGLDLIAEGHEAEIPEIRAGFVDPMLDENLVYKEHFQVSNQSF